MITENSHFYGYGKGLLFLLLEREIDKVFGDLKAF